MTSRSVIHLKTRRPGRSKEYPGRFSINTLPGNPKEIWANYRIGDFTSRLVCHDLGENFPERTPWIDRVRYAVHPKESATVNRDAAEHLTDEARNVAHLRRSIAHTHRRVVPGAIDLVDPD